MSTLHDVAKAERLHIALLGNRNAGKSSLINALTGQPVALVSDIKGTTTDPVEKAMELLPLGPVVLIDTAGIDDEGNLGEKRVQKTLSVLSRTDIALFVTENEQLDERESAFVAELKGKNLPLIIVHNKADKIGEIPPAKEGEIFVSAKSGEGIEALKNMLGALAPDKEQKKLVADLLQKGDTVILVTPIDAAAPKGRLILPQVQTLRDILDAGASALVCQPDELQQNLENLTAPPRLVITDSQAFGEIAPLVPEDVALTTFSILFARYKGNLDQLVAGEQALQSLSDGDKILVSEGCTHHRQCGDIGTDKLPRKISAFCGKEVTFEFTGGKAFPEDLSPYRLILHCGGCMLTETEMKYRLQKAKAAGIPTLNYGMAFACFEGQLSRALQPLQKK